MASETHASEQRPLVSMLKRAAAFEITDEQYMQIIGLLALVEEQGGSIIAQVYGDGVRCRHLNPEQTQAVAAVLGGSGSHNSAFQAHLDSLKKD